jgi:hypothetical protein
MNFIDNYVSFVLSILFTMAVSYSLIHVIIKNRLLSLILTLSKYSVFICYYLLWSHYRPVILVDDQTYYYESIELFNQGEGSLFYLFNSETMFTFMVTAGGYHFGYYIFNYLSFFLFGPYYYSPVLVNIFITLISSILLYKTLMLARVNNRFCIFYFCFFLLHWDIISWSSFLNIKDSLVQFLTISTIFCLVKINVHGFKLKLLLVILSIFFILYFIRFYFIAFLLVTAVVYFFINFLSRLKSSITDLALKISIFTLLPVGFYIVFIRLFSSRIDGIGPRTNIIKGFTRHILTPIPYNIDPEYSFITISSYLHWLLFLLFPIGLYIFMKRHFYSLMPFLILFFLLSVFYGSFAELQGPRHRFPQVAFISMIQALGLYEVLSKIKKEKIFHPDI